MTVRNFINSALAIWASLLLALFVQPVRSVLAHRLQQCAKSLLTIRLELANQFAEPACVSVLSAAGPVAHLTFSTSGTSPVSTSGSPFGLSVVRSDVYVATNRS